MREYRLFSHNGKVYGLDRSDRGWGYDLWAYDPTSDSVDLVGATGPIMPGFAPDWVIPVGDRLYFELHDNSTYGRELWWYDITADTVDVLNINPSGNSSPSRPIPYDNALYFEAWDGVDQSLRRYDPLTGDLTEIEESTAVAPDGRYGSMIVYHDWLYFRGEDADYGTELWRYDASTAAVERVTDIDPGTGDAFPSNFYLYNDVLYFTAHDNSHQIWSYDVNTDQTTPITAAPSGTASRVIGFGDAIFFAADDGFYGVELWRYDIITHDIDRVTDIAPGTDSANPGNFIMYDDALFFSADDNSTYGVELWRYDSDTGIATRVTDIAPGYFDAEPRYLATLDDTLYFGATDTVNGRQVWAHRIIPTTLNQNTSFEQGETSPDSWTLFSRSTLSAWQCALGTAFSGDCAIHLTGPTRQIEAVYTDLNISGPAGDEFTISAAIRGADITDMTALGVIIYREDGTKKKYWVRIPAGSGDWKTLAKTFATTLPYNKIRVGVLFRPVDGDVWVDDLILSMP